MLLFWLTEIVYSRSVGTVSIYMTYMTYDGLHRSWVPAWYMLEGELFSNCEWKPVGALYEVLDHKIDYLIMPPMLYMELCITSSATGRV